MSNNTNIAAVVVLTVVGGLVGLACGKRLTERYQKTIVANMLPSLVVAVIWSFVEGALNG